MKEYVKYLSLVVFLIFSFYYTDKVIELSEYNNTILVSIDEYAKDYDYKCKEGSIKEEGIILGLSGLVVDKNKSYSNMKGIGFREELVEFKEDKCILNKNNNLDKYILKGNEYEDNISLIIDIDTGKYFDKFIKIASDKGIEINYLFNYNMLNANIDKVDNYNNVLFKGKNVDDFIRILHDEFFCVKTDEFDIIDVCKDKKLNSIKMINVIDKELLSNIKKILNKGEIVFIKENYVNLNEFSSTINYIKSKGYNIVSISELLS